MQPVFWDKGRSGKMSAKALARIMYQRMLMKQVRARLSLRDILREAVPILSADNVLSNRKERLIDRVRYINDTYSG